MGLTPELVAAVTDDLDPQRTFQYLSLPTVTQILQKKNKYKLPFNYKTHPAEYQRAYYAVKKAEKQVQAAKGTASIKSVSKGP